MDDSRYTAAMNTLRPLVLALACALPMAAMAQWQWLDKDGRKVFSDRAPPADIPPNRILKQPGAVSATPIISMPGSPEPAAAGASAPAGGTAAASPQPNASAPKLTGKDKELEARKKAAEAEEAKKKAEEKERLAAIRVESCKRAKASKAHYESGVRIGRTNEKGEREILDDAQRAVELKRIEGIIAKDCPPLS
jgi:hypothetical protein